MTNPQPEAPSAEDALIDWLKHEAGTLGSAIGDDLATLPSPGDLALKVDQQIAGIHYPPDLDPALVATRLMAVNLSDMAAGGAEPIAAMLALAAPIEYDRKRFFRGLLDACERFQVALLGGDVARSPTASASLTLLGKRPQQGRWIRRSGARPGDLLWLGGQVGLSALGRELVERGARILNDDVIVPAELRLEPALERTCQAAVRRHLQPDPQLALGQWLARQHRAAAIDVSDGLALDLARLCRASGTGARIESGPLEWPPDEMRLAASLGVDAAQLALGGGEDYVLLFALPAGIEPPSEAFRIGIMTRDGKLEISDADGIRTLEPTGWDHLRKRR